MRHPDLVSEKLSSNLPLNSSASVSSSANQRGWTRWVLQRLASRCLEPVRGPGRSWVRGRAGQGRPAAQGFVSRPAQQLFPLAPPPHKRAGDQCQEPPWCELQPHGDALGKAGPSFINMNFPVSQSLLLAPQYQLPGPSSSGEAGSPDLHLGTWH